MDPITTNYGLAGGTLDASKYIAAAIPKLLTASEQKQLAPFLQLQANIEQAKLDGRPESN